MRPAYEPVEIRHDDGSWTVGRITGWWRSPDGTSWCRLRATGEPAPRWVVFDPAHLSLLPTSGT